MRPAAAIIRLLKKHHSSVYFTYEGKTVNARSITSILTLVAKKGADIVITVEGKDAKKTMESLIEGFENRFEEEKIAYGEKTWKDLTWSSH